MRALSIAVAAGAIALAAGAADADVKGDAKRHFESGLALMNAEDYKAAAVEFEESTSLYKTKSAIFNLANCYKALKRYSESLATLKLLEGEFVGRIDAEMKNAIAIMRAEIDSITGTLEVRVDAAGASIFVDGELVGKSPLPVPILLGPGYHEVRAERPGKAPVTRKVKLVSRERRVVELAFGGVEGPPATAAHEAAAASKKEPSKPKPEPEPDLAPEESTPKRSPLLLALSIVGTAATVGLGATAGVYWGKKSGAADDYDDYLKSYARLDPAATSYDYVAEEERLYGELTDARESVDENNKIAVGLTVGAGVAAAASAVLWVLWARSGEESAEPAAVSFAPAPGGVGVEF